MVKSLVSETSQMSLFPSHRTAYLRGRLGMFTLILSVDEGD